MVCALTKQLRRDFNSFHEGNVPAENDATIKITGTGESPLYVMLHRAEGITSDYQSQYAADYINKVNIVTQPENPSLLQGSTTVAQLASCESYQQANWGGTTNTLIIQVCGIEVGSPDQAQVIVYLDGVNSESCPVCASDSPSVSNAPSSIPSSVPSKNPSKTPSSIPSSIPSKKPSNTASTYPSSSPLPPATKAPTKAPVQAPTTSSPSRSPIIAPVTSDPSNAPSTAPSTSPSISTAPSPLCRDSQARFRHWGMKRKCKWVAKNKEKRCARTGLQRQCPVTCGKCDEFRCSDSKKIFYLPNNGEERDCFWVAKLPKRIWKRCSRAGVTTTCRHTCGFCDT